MYLVEMAGSAQRDYKSIPKDQSVKIKRTILSFEKDPRPFGAIKLIDHLHRVRVDKWRILYDIYDKEKKVLVLHILRRSERTYKKI